MIERDALEYLVEDCSMIQTVTIDGYDYSTKPLHLIQEPKFKSIELTTLDSFIDYVNEYDQPLSIIVNVIGPTRVELISRLFNEFKERDVYAVCMPDLPFVTTGRFLSLEEFNIMLQSVFVPSEDLAKVLSVVGGVQSETVQNIDDDGITQQVAVRAGIQRKDTAIVPNPVTLYPFRTFVEIEQPESKFVLRLKDGPTAALFEADGGAWRIQAVKSIKSYIEEHLEDKTILVLA